MLKIVRHVFLAPVYLYQKLISPLFPSSCIYQPSCSHYMKGAVLKLGVFKGLIAGLLRIGRCAGGLYTGGEDPVPEKFKIVELFAKYKEFRQKKTKRSCQK